MPESEQNTMLLPMSESHLHLVAASWSHTSGSSCLLKSSSRSPSAPLGPWERDEKQRDVWSLCSPPVLLPMPPRVHATAHSGLYSLLQITHLQRNLLLDLLFQSHFCSLSAHVHPSSWPKVSACTWMFPVSFHANSGSYCVNFTSLALVSPKIHRMSFPQTAPLWLFKWK